MDNNKNNRKKKHKTTNKNAPPVLANGNLFVTYFYNHTEYKVNKYFVYI